VLFEEDEDHFVGPEFRWLELAVKLVSIYTVGKEKIAANISEGNNRRYY